jgi:diaminopimelate decarboxylase
VRGLHLYVGTDLMEISLFESGYARLGALVKHFPELEYLDLGGGFGVPREGGAPFDVPAYGEMVTAFMEACSASAGRRLRLVLEPGRVVGATAGIFVCRVTDVKHRAGKQLVGVDASSAQFPRPLFYPETARHPAWILRAGACVEGPARLSMVYGCSTYSRDYLVRNQALPEAREGDLVCLGQAGSYCASSHTRFLGFEPAPEYFA